MDITIDISKGSASMDALREEVAKQTGHNADEITIFNEDLYALDPDAVFGPCDKAFHFLFSTTPTKVGDPSESESEDEPEEISTCNCKPDWDIRCCCYPPMITKYFPATMTDGDIGWYKKDGHQDNWDNCPMKVGNAVWHYTNSRLSNDNRTKKGEYNLKYAKWVFGLMGLKSAQIKDAIDILKEQREED